jgi:dATP pyrophosphohydrolase
MPQIDANVVEVYVFRRLPGVVEFLLIQRRAGDYMGGTWHPVSGAIEPGQKAWQAALRELREEAGLTPLRLWQVDAINPFYIAECDRVILGIAFAAEASPDAAVVLSDEHTGQRWSAVDEFAAALIFPGQRRMLAEIREHILTPSAAEPHLRIPLG